jgi:hypothetical protein
MRVPHPSRPIHTAYQNARATLDPMKTSLDQIGDKWGIGLEGYYLVGRGARLTWSTLFLCCVSVLPTDRRTYVCSLFRPAGIALPGASRTVAVKGFTSERLHAWQESGRGLTAYDMIHARVSGSLPVAVRSRDGRRIGKLDQHESLTECP